MTETANTQSEAQPQGSRLPPVSGYLPLLAHQNKSERSEANFPPVLDACCGARTMWFDHADSRAVYMDRRIETYIVDRGTPMTKGRKPVVIDPQVKADFTSMPFPDASFWHVVFDPPHYTEKSMTPNSHLAANYGLLIGGWEEMLAAGFSECFRVLKPFGTLVLKWCSTEIPLARVLALTSYKPLYGHTSGRKAATHWVAFLKHTGAVAPAAAEDNMAHQPPRELEKKQP